MLAPMTMHHLIDIAFAAATGLVTWIGKLIWNFFQNEWIEVKEKLTAIEATTRVQAENHLETIQHQGAKTNELLEKVVENQIELNGWLKGWASRD